jgi:hypothetical protein
VAFVLKLAVAARVVLLVTLVAGRLVVIRLMLRLQIVRQMVTVMLMSINLVVRYCLVS